MKTKLLKTLLIGSLVLSPLALAEDVRKQTAESRVLPSKLSKAEALAVAKSNEAILKAGNVLAQDGAMKDFAGGKIKGMQTVPGTDGLRLIQLDNDDLFLMTQNGRYFMKMDVMYDIWKAKRIKTAADAAGSDKVTLEEMRINAGELGYFTYGTGDKLISILIDPNSPHTQLLLKAAEVTKDEFAYRFMILPVSGKQSESIARKLWCNVPNTELFETIKNADFENIPTNTDGCDIRPVASNVALAAVLGIKGAPYIIRNDGAHRTGIPTSSEKYLNWLRKGS